MDFGKTGCNYLADVTIFNERFANQRIEIGNKKRSGRKMITEDDFVANK